jgi:catechol 2,3-dioxygenase-like lactoylglutathione lyase family enzyme
MNVKRVGFVGSRTGNFEAMTAFVRDVLGLDGGFLHPTHFVAQLPSASRDYVEVFGLGEHDERLWPPLAEGVLIAFIVDDLVGAREEMVAAGVAEVGELVWASDVFDNPSLENFGWFFFRAPDGNLYAIQQAPD